jgi:fibronectin-binding autotransporter adhesin
MSIALACFTLVAINLLVATSLAQGRTASTLINCSGSIQACIDAANDGDTILIAAGRYTESLTLSKPVSLTGENRDTTIIHAVEGQRVLTVTGATISTSVVISGLTFTGGDASGGLSCPQYCGGGLLIKNSAQPLVCNSRFISNTAQYGGALYTDSPMLTLIDSDFEANTGGGVVAGTSRISGGHFSNNTGGQGLTVSGTLEITGMQFISNELGGINAGQGPATIVDARFEGNSGEGGLYFYGFSSGGASPLILSNTVFIRNFPGMYASSAQVTIFRSRFENNHSNAGGAALWVDGNYPPPPVVMIDTEVVSNVAHGGSGFGGAVTFNGAVHVLRGRFENNSSDAVFGGGLYANPAYLTDTQFISNSSPVGGGLFGDAYIYGGRFERNASAGIGGAMAGGDFYLSGTVVISNTTDYNGGGVSAAGTTTLINVRMENNRATTGGGGGVQTNVLVITNSQILSNTAVQGGGAIVFDGGRVVNTVFAGNRAISNGAAIAITVALNAPGRLDLLHTTIANTILSPQPAIAVLTDTLYLTNTIITSHTIAISNTGGMVYEDYNLFFNTVTDTIDVTNGGHSLIGDPKFVDPLNGNYHLQFGSAAIDHGVDAGVYTDLDGHLRPIGLGFDIGAYEYQSGHYLWLPLIRK